MIGNDIIDLKVAATESNPLRPGYISKIFTPLEQQYIEDTKESVLQIWILWAMKEAAYKAHQRRFNLPQRFNPTQLECQILEEESTSVSGVVTIQQHTYPSSVSVTKQYLHASASPLPQHNIFTGIFPASVDVKKELLLKFSRLKNMPVNLLSITKNEDQVPLIQYKERKLNHPFSLSHHGFYAAFSLSLTNY